MPSTVIAGSRYDARSQSFLIVFLSGAKYLYKKVPDAVYKKYQSARSKGKFLNTKIKGHFEFEKMIEK